MKNLSLGRNLTRWQKFWLPINYLRWLATPDNLRDPWATVVGRFEKHSHKYTIPLSHRIYRKYKIMKCEHPECNMVDVID